MKTNLVGEVKPFNQMSLGDIWASNLTKAQGIVEDCFQQLGIKVETEGDLFTVVDTRDFNLDRINRELEQCNYRLEIVNASPGPGLKGLELKSTDTFD